MTKNEKFAHDWLALDNDESVYDYIEDLCEDDLRDLLIDILKRNS